MGHKCFQIAAVAGLSLLTVIARSRGAEIDPDGAAAPFIPSFWDPQTPVEKPDLGTLTSIRFVTGSDYPPFDFTLPDGTVTGFNVDLARALCDELKVSCTIQARAWTALRPALNDNAADAAIASMSIDERAPDIAFTSAYYKTPARFVARLASPGPTLPDDLDGKRVGVQAGTTHAAYLKAFFPKIAAKLYPTIEVAHAALQAGELDAVFGDAIEASLWLGGTDAAGCCSFAGGAYAESRFFGPGAGIAVRKSDALLREALDYALARVAAKGIYGDLYLRYFPIGFY